MGEGKWFAITGVRTTMAIALKHLEATIAAGEAAGQQAETEEV